ncbi:MAG: LysM peptidoglycan-binding domain-containing protein [bacterium]
MKRLSLQLKAFMKRVIHIILLLFICLQAKANYLQPQDSVGIANKDGKYFIIHEVTSRQTLFALSKIYKVRIQEILEANEGMRPALATGQLLYIPAKSFNPTANTEFSTIVNGKLVSGNTAVEEAPKLEPEKELKQAAIPPPPKKEKPKEEVEEPAIPVNEKFNWDYYYGDKDLYHTVKRGETLYKIATYYGLSVQELMELNNLENSLIEKNQELLIRKGKKKKYSSENTKPKKKEEPKVEKPKTEPVEEIDEIKPTATKEVKEAGTVMVIDDSFPDADKNIALHPTARVGTIILVSNNASKESVYVRVVGLLQSDDKNVVVMISPEAAKTIGIKGSKGQVQLSYAQ